MGWWEGIDGTIGDRYALKRDFPEPEAKIVLKQPEQWILNSAELS